MMIARLTGVLAEAGSVYGVRDVNDVGYIVQPLGKTMTVQD